MSHAIDVGDRFGRYVVVRDVPGTMGRRSVLVRCDCGTERTIGDNNPFRRAWLRAAEMA